MNKVPKNSDWCSLCIRDGTLCSDHRDEHGQRKEYDGQWPPAYEPSDWVLSVVGTYYDGYDGNIFLCFGYDPRQGFWMQNVRDVADKRNVSERAIDRTFHRTKAPNT